MKIKEILFIKVERNKKEAQIDAILIDPVDNNRIAF
ncbi:hypothetical protein SAMN05421777_10797 [Fluoribacter gormanii]|uniref:Uncharacterized protein n=1 Tax=Fluoribacter gormanii TaxID=464 RepID=A0A377GN38_9GAMM|nr:hypothetical protein SAMN05421777_10797 [Fluoribacter gormanii]STO26219.1 Uncharacterised protein [Fluoribacter gormanii]